MKKGSTEFAPTKHANNTKKRVCDLRRQTNGIALVAKSILKVRVFSVV
jgi:hypothetical protein